MPGLLEKLSRILFSSVICITLCVCFVLFFTGCRDGNKVFKKLPSDAKGVLLIEGYVVSGSLNRYWSIDMQDRNLSELRNDFEICYLTLASPSRLPRLEYVRKLIQRKANTREHDKSEKTSVFAKGIRGVIDVVLEKARYDSSKKKERTSRTDFMIDTTDVVTANKQYEVLVRSEDKIIQIYNMAESTTKEIKIEHKLCCHAVSPDSKYLAYLEYQPFVFRDGKVYRLWFVDLETGNKYSIKYRYVSLPDAMIWVDNSFPQGEE